MELSSELFIWGNDPQNQFSLAVSYSPLSFSLYLPIKQISCGVDHSAFVTLSGQLYTFTAGDKIKHLLPEIKDVSCGAHHGLALTCDGDIYSWGNSQHGALGSGKKTVQSYPQLLSLPKAA